MTSPSSPSGALPDPLADASARAQRGNLHKDAEKLERQGKLFVRDRLDLLLDKGSFVEDGLLANALADDLPADGVLVEIHWSSVNYKDGLAASPTGKVARISPIVPGVDLAGVLVDDAGALSAGTPVLAHGYDLGVSRHGGFAQYARVPAEWLVPIPDGLSAREAMIVGTAGFTAAMSVIALEEHAVQS